MVCAYSYPLSANHNKFPQLVDLAHAQDVEAGDGTTTVTVLAGALLGSVQKLLSKGIHPSIIADAYLRAAAQSEKILESMSTPVDLSDRETLLSNANTALNSKVVLPFLLSFHYHLHIQTGSESVL